MFEWMRVHQLNIMLVLCGVCGILVFLLINTRFLSKNRKIILILMELSSFCLLWFDRMTYLYAGDMSHKGYYMVRISNFIVFFMTSGIIFVYNLYLADLLKNEVHLAALPRRLMFTGAVSMLGMMLSVISALTNLYYYFDQNNVYHRGKGFFIAYVVSVFCPILQYTVIRQYKKEFSRMIYTSLVLYFCVPLICAFLQIFAYGISIVNIAIAAVSISLYIFMYLDLNLTVERAYEIQIQNMRGQQVRMQRVFDQTATAFVSAVEKKDDFTKGNALRIAEYARRIAELAGKSEEDCEKVYYTALLHDVGLIGVPDSVIKNEADPDTYDYEAIRKKPVIGAEILESITEYPYLSQGARYSHERYNGTGYPQGLKGNEIPDIARIVAVADAYVTMTTRKRYREARPVFEAREAFVKGAGEEFDPVYAEIMVAIIDSESREQSSEITVELEDEISCAAYREHISAGIPVESEIVKISFDCEMPMDEKITFFGPAAVLFDSYDGRIHDNRKAIESYHYLEYGEVWFDQHSITTEARKIEEQVIREGEDTDSAWADGHYEILAGRSEDHLKLVMSSKRFSKEVIVALPGGSKTGYIGLTGENCRISDICVEKTGETVRLGDIRKIVEPISYIDHLVSDIRNVQMDRSRSAYSEGIELKDEKLKIEFHTMSLPGSSLVWHCPYVVLYSSDHGRVGEKNYREYALIKLNGENEATDEFASNKFIMKKKEEFPGWDSWKEINQRGLDCSVVIVKRGNVITLKTETLGISIESTTTFREEPSKVYAALTGDQVALTDIRLELL